MFEEFQVWSVNSRFDHKMHSVKNLPKFYSVHFLTDFSTLVTFFRQQPFRFLLRWVVTSQVDLLRRPWRNLKITTTLFRWSKWEISMTLPHWHIGTWYGVPMGFLLKQTFLKRRRWSPLTRVPIIFDALTKYATANIGQTDRFQCQQLNCKETTLLLAAIVFNKRKIIESLTENHPQPECRSDKNALWIQLYLNI